jgi:imidazoleglycerol phosphate synthase glutamine amidotransferase subunit HisH
LSVQREARVLGHTGWNCLSVQREARVLGHTGWNCLSVQREDTVLGHTGWNCLSVQREARVLGHTGWNCFSVQSEATVLGHTGWNCLSVEGQPTGKGFVSRSRREVSHNLTRLMASFSAETCNKKCIMRLAMPVWCHEECDEWNEVCMKFYIRQFHLHSLKH